MDFHQAPPRLTNTFHSDPLLEKTLKKRLPPDVWTKMSAHLKHVGELAVTDWLTWSQQAERELPVHVPFDPWGERVDQIRMSAGWTQLEAAAATEGIVATAYERNEGEWSRVYQAALLYLYHPSSAFVSCPLAMTDGAARAIELYGDDELKKNAFKHLTSRDPKTFWTSGQWMTEKIGGSDVSGTETVARKSSAQNGFDWQLNGVKWFTSATTSQMAMLLARPEGAEMGSRGLSLFYTELRDPNQNLRNIEILRLKDKLGTKALPTAELRLTGTPARLVGEMGGGVKKISSLFNVTRVYNSICSLGQWRRALDLAWAYADVRVAFGKKLKDLPLHRITLKNLETDFEKAFELTFFVAHLLGKDECGTATEKERTLLRAVTPIAKLWTGKKCVEACSEVVESFGGAGYIEDVGVAKMLRDAQVLSIWEGTTNVLSLDFLRALEKEQAAPVLAEYLQTEGARYLATPKGQAEWQEVQSLLAQGQKNGRDYLESQARRLSFLVAELIAGARLVS
ncbi:MAG: acyl-CoA dehydrogenase family protein [Bdellovibrionaceae bacterium]|nr:acyl-CoA dehydrogenase family protein [Pseudobdellovibrionaceae bacterium]